MVVVPLVYPFGIRIGRMRILGPTAVTIIFVIGGLALLAFTVREIMQARKLIAQGGEITVESAPEQGTTFFIQGQPQGAPVGDAEYFGMILRIWLGQSPADPMLKEALVGAGASAGAAAP